MSEQGAPERTAKLVEQLRWEAKYAAVEVSFDGDLTPENTYHWAAADEIERLVALADGYRAALEQIARIIETVDNRCLAADGPVPHTLSEMTQAEISEIYALARVPTERHGKTPKDGIISDFESYVPEESP